MLAKQFNIHVNLAKQCLWSFKEQHENLSVVFLVSGIFQKGKKVLLVWNNHLNFVMSKIHQLECLHVYSVQLHSSMNDFEEKAPEEESIIESKELKTNQPLIKSFFKSISVSTCVGNNSSSLKREEDLVQTELKRFFYTGYLPNNLNDTSEDQKAAARDGENIEDNVGIDSQEFLMENQDDFYLYKAAEETESRAVQFEMSSQDDAFLCESIEDAEKANDDNFFETDNNLWPTREMDTDSQDDIQLYQVTESLDIYEVQEESSFDFDGSSQDDVYLYEALENSEEVIFDKTEDYKHDSEEEQNKECSDKGKSDRYKLINNQSIGEKKIRLRPREVWSFQPPASWKPRPGRIITRSSSARQQAGNGTG